MKARKREREKDERDTERNRQRETKGPETAVFLGGPVVKPSSSNAGSLIPGWGAEIPHVSQPRNQNIRQKQYCNKFNKDKKKWPRETEAERARGTERKGENVEAHRTGAWTCVPLEGS